MISSYELNENLKFLTKSEIRLKILSELEKEPLSIKELVEKTNITYSSVSSNVNKLEKLNHIEKYDNVYYINPISQIYFKSLMDFKYSIDMIIDYDEFWSQHNINNLSLESIQNITDLKESRLIETTPLDIFKTHNVTKKQILESGSVKAIFPYLHPEYPSIIEQVLKNEGYVELILPKDIFRETLFSIDEATRKKATKNGKLKVYAAKNDLKIYLTVCDESMGLGLFKNDGSFDQNRILISDDEKSKNWAGKLFENIKNEM